MLVFLAGVITFTPTKDVKIFKLGKQQWQLVRNCDSETVRYLILYAVYKWMWRLIFFYVLTGEINCMAVLINQTQINEEFKFTPVWKLTPKTVQAENLAIASSETSKTHFHKSINTNIHLLAKPSNLMYPNTFIHNSIQFHTLYTFTPYMHTSKLNISRVYPFKVWWGHS